MMKFKVKVKEETDIDDWKWEVVRHKN